MDRTTSARDAYRFLLAREGKFVSYADVARATRGTWSDGTVRNYRSKKWKTFTAARLGGFYINGLALLSEDEFVALQSQVQQAIVDERIRVIDIALTTGEGQTVEFKSSLPTNASDLAKEIAAFSTSNDGTILIGVTDAGAVVGYSDSSERIEGIIRNVAPSPTASVDLVRYRGKQVGLIRIRKGSEPVYYAFDRPYLRQGSLSRPATPDEVKSLILKNSAVGGSTRRRVPTDAHP